ncbi:MAG: methionine--tRNA ligase subunit beta [Bacillota bacterium]|nr:MAG: methionine--tRNA ligase subunit beta [Bacillota bacterium]
MAVCRTGNLRFYAVSPIPSRVSPAWVPEPRRASARSTGQVCGPPRRPESLGTRGPRETTTPLGTIGTREGPPASRMDRRNGKETIAMTISIDEFARVDLRTARVLEADRVERTDKLLRLRIDVGGEERQIVAGIGAHYEPGTLVGRTIVIVANLEPATIRGVESNGMLLAALHEGRLAVLTTDGGDFPPGAQVR